jgi:hypothetical protein
LPFPEQLALVHARRYIGYVPTALGNTRFTPVRVKSEVVGEPLPVETQLVVPGTALSVKEYAKERTPAFVVTVMRQLEAVEPGGPSGGTFVVAPNGQGTVDAAIPVPAGGALTGHGGSSLTLVMLAADATAGVIAINAMTAARPQTTRPIRQR